MTQAFQPISYLRAFGLLCFGVICPSAGLLLFNAGSVNGALFAVGAILLGLSPFLAWLDPENSHLRKIAFFAFCGWLMIAVWLLTHTPDGHPQNGSRVMNRFVGNQWNYQMHALGAIVPEIDQIRLGLALVPAVDPLLSRTSARSLARLNQDIYNELEFDADFRALGSMMPAAYDELLGLKFDVGHYFLYVPRRLTKSLSAPAIVFLHGSGGNFKSYTWLLSKVADDCGRLLIVPSYGMGNWDRENSPNSIVAALDDASNIVPINRDDVTLAGLSNGGLGACHAAVSSAGHRFSKLILFSPVCDLTDLNSDSFSTQWNGKSALIVTGESDNRVPFSYVEKVASTMRSAGVHLTFNHYPQADHFLFYSHRELWTAEVTQWIKANTPNAKQ